MAAAAVDVHDPAARSPLRRP